jgi:hypothetical protein
MKSFKQYVSESVSYTNWQFPSDEQLRLEYKLEYVNKNLDKMTNNAYPNESAFVNAAKSANVISLTKEMDRKVSYRSHTKTKDELVGLLKGYRSWPKYRNMDTVNSMYQAFEDNKPMPMSIILKFPDGKMRVLGGNTRLDVAFQLGITPKVILMELP